MSLEFNNVNKKNILIVGAGPTGLLLGCFLLKQDIPCTIIDFKSQISTDTRAVGLTTSTVKLFDDLDLIEKLKRKAIVSSKIQVYIQGKLYIAFKNKKNNSIFSKFIYTTQPILENLLLEKFVSLGGNVNWSTKFLNLIKTQNDYKVNILKDERIESQQFRFVVGCDGGASSVRQYMKPQYERDNYNAFFLIADVDAVTELDVTNAHYFLHDNGYFMLVPLPDGRCRLIFSFLGEYVENLHESFDISNLEQIALERSQISIKINNIIWKTSAPFRHQFVQSPVCENIILAGDSLHLFSPVGGTNMNMGFLDSEALCKCFVNIYNSIEADIALAEYTKNSLNRIKRNLEITKNLTHLITGNNNVNNSFKNLFVPCRKNIDFLRNQLIKEISLCY